MTIESNPFGGAKLTGDDARAFRYHMAFADVASELKSGMARKVEPEIWATDDICERLRSLKRAKDWLEALADCPDAVKVLRKIIALRKERDATSPSDLNRGAVG